MKSVSNGFLNQLNVRSKKTKAYIVLPDNTLITKFNGNSFVFQNTCYQDGYIIGNNIAKSVEFEIYNDNYDLNVKEFELFIGMYVDEIEDYEYLSYGKYLIDSLENVVSSNIIKIKAFDYMIKFNGEYEDNHDYTSTPITLKEYVETFCQYYGVELGSTTFINENFLITEKPESDGLTGRQILKSIGEITGSFCEIGVDNKLYFKLKNNNERIRIPKSMMSSLVVNEETKPINCVVIKLGGNVDGENISKPDEESINLYGENSLIIEDNIFLNTSDKRVQVIDEIFEKVNGFKYIPFTVSEGSNPLFVETSDLVSIQNKNGEYFDSIWLSHVIKVPNLTKSSFGASALTEAQEEYKYTPQDVVGARRAELIVYKTLGEISSLSSKITTVEKNNSASIKEILGKFDNYVPENDFLVLENTVKNTQTDTYSKLEIDTKLTDGSVTKVKSKSLLADENGLTIDETDSNTKTNLDVDGLQILDKTSGSEEVLLEAIYDKDKGETVVRSKNIIVEKYLNIGSHSRIEDYENGTGVFYIG